MCPLGRRRIPLADRGRRGRYAARGGSQALDAHSETTGRGFEPSPGHHSMAIRRPILSAKNGPTDSVSTISAATSPSGVGKCSRLTRQMRSGLWRTRQVGAAGTNRVVRGGHIYNGTLPTVLLGIAMGSTPMSTRARWAFAFCGRSSVIPVIFPEVQPRLPNPPLTSRPRRSRKPRRRSRMKGKKIRRFPASESRGSATSPSHRLPIIRRKSPLAKLVTTRQRCRGSRPRLKELEARVLTRHPRPLASSGSTTGRIPQAGDW